MIPAARTARPTGRRAVALIATFAVVVAAVLALVGDRSSSTVGAQSAAAPIEWGPCEAQPSPYDCATYAVPLDHDRPAGPQIRLGLLRHPATGAPEDRIGTLFVNPGGPGAEAGPVVIDTIPRFSPEVLAAFDIVAFTPRGITGGAPTIDCPINDPAIPTSPDWTAYFTQSVAAKAQTSTACQAAVARTGAYYGTGQVAHDLDLLRRAVGDDGLTYWGISYGTRIGEIYAQAFPDDIRALVLDGNVDPFSTVLSFAADRGGSHDDALEVFYTAYPWAEDAVASVRAALADGPITARDVLTGAAVELTSANFATIVLQPLLSNERLWPTMAQIIDNVAEQVDGGPTAEVVVITLPDNFGAVLTQVNCLDLPGRPTVPEMAAAAETMVAEGPVLGSTMAIGLDICAGFPLPPDPAPSTPPAALPPTLLLASRHDPATPYEWSDTMRAFLPGAVRVTYEGTTHGVWNTTSTCIDDIADAYVLDLVVPEPGLSCPFVDPNPAAAPGVEEIDPATLPDL